MPPKSASCACVTHDANVANQKSSTGQDKFRLFNLTKDKKVRKALVSSMIEKSLLPSRCKYICSICVQTYDVDDPVSEVAGKKQKTLNVDIDQLCRAIAESEICDSDISKLSEALGERIIAAAIPPSNQYDIDNLETINLSESINTFDPILVALLRGLSKNNTSPNISIRIVNALEHLYYVMHTTYIGPLNFCMNLITHFVTGSKSIVELRGKHSPSASYSTLMRFLEKSSTTTTTSVPETGDGVTFFDNNQVLVRNWNVTYDSKALVSVVTTLLFMQPPLASSLQNNPDLSPYKWLSKSPIDTSVITKQPIYDTLFRQKRNEYINSLLQTLYADQLTESDTIRDHIDTENVVPGSDTTTATIQAQFDDANTVKFTTDKFPYNPYDSVPSEVAGKAHTTLLDPLFVNPCSYINISRVFDYILEQSDREWSAIGSDGLPYILGSRIIDRYHTCPICEETFNTLSKFQTHCVNESHDLDASDCRTYGKILLIPGLGHYEINYTKAMFKLLWPVCLIDLAKMLGWRSIKALTYCEMASNHHKSWQMLQILLHGTAPELLLPYIRDCVKSSVSPSVEGLYSFVETVQNPNFIFMFKAIFTYLFALDLFRTGVRRNNTQIIHCAMYKLSPLFYGLHMTQYMEIDLRRQILYNTSPECVQELIDNLSCMSRSGHHSKGEGGDFILENSNKRVKMWMPPGVANEKRWLRVYRNLPSMEKIKHKLQTGEDSVGEDDIDETGIRKHSNSLEIYHWRRKLRLAGYFTVDKTQPHALSMQSLDPDLINFDEKIHENQSRYVIAYPEAYRCENIFFTPEDRRKHNDIGNKTVAIIRETIEKTICTIANEGGIEESETLTLQWKKIKTCTKPVLLAFHRDVLQTLEEVNTKTRDVITHADLEADADQEI